MILITGGAGYIGAHVNKLLNDAGRDTVVFDNLSTGRRELARWGTFVEGDLADRELLDRCFEQYPIEAVMHLSASSLVGESVSDPASYYRNNVANTLNLLDAMRKRGVRFLVFSSSCSVYGAPERMPIPEDHLRRPVNPYGQSKLMAEELLQDYDGAYGIRSASLRYFNAAGADPGAEIGEWHEPETHLIPLVLDAALSGPPVRLFGTDYDTPDGTCIRDYIHVNDVARAHVAALEYLVRGDASSAFNLANGTGFSVLQVIDAARRVTGRDIRTVAETRRPGDLPVLVGSAEKAAAILNWKPDRPGIDTIIGDAWAWHKKLKKGGEVR